MKIRIKATGHFYHGTLNVIPDGCVRNHMGEILEFPSILEAHTALTSDVGMFGVEHDGGGVYSLSGSYVLAHNQYARPDYTMVEASSGKSNKSIRAACENINTKLRQADEA